MGNEIDRQAPGVLPLRPYDANLFPVDGSPASGHPDEYVDRVSLTGIRDACEAGFWDSHPAPSAALKYVQALWATQDNGWSTWIPEGFLHAGEHERVLFSVAAEEVSRGSSSESHGAGQFLRDAAAGRLPRDPVEMGFTGRLPPPTLSELAEPAPLNRAIGAMRPLAQMAGGLPLMGSHLAHQSLLDALLVLERFSSVEPESFRLRLEERHQLEEAIAQLRPHSLTADPAFAASFLRQLVQRADPGDPDFCSILVEEMNRIASGRSPGEEMPTELIHEWHRQMSWSSHPFGNRNTRALEKLIQCLDKGQPNVLREEDVADFHRVVGTIESIVDRQDPRAVPLVGLLHAVGAAFAQSDDWELRDLGARCQAVFLGSPDEWRSEAEQIAQPLLQGLDRSAPPTLFDHQAQFDTLFPNRQVPTEVSLTALRDALEDLHGDLRSVISRIHVAPARNVIDSLISNSSVDGALPDPIPLVDLQGLSLEEREDVLLVGEMLAEDPGGQANSEVQGLAAQLYALGWKTKPARPDA